MESLPTVPDDSSGTNPSSVKSDGSSPRQDGGRGSPPPNCAICLGTCRNKSFTDSCLHQFCFKCLLTWSKVKAECPLCKQNFKSIIHNVRSNHQYEEYMVEQQQAEVLTNRADVENLRTVTRRFRYSTTFTLPRQETIAIQQLLMHYPLMAGVLPPPRRRRSPASFRRTVYRHNLWARPLPDFTGRFRDSTPEFYRYNDTQMHRLVPWLNRELSYLLNDNVGHISYVMARILELLPQYGITSPEFRDAMRRYFGERTEHFLHELYCFASTPYDMTGYDRNVQYTTDSRISTMVNEVISSSESEASVDSDIVMVSSSEPADTPAGPSGVAPPATDNVIPIETISQSDTDDDSSEVMVVGYIKPPQERTPEVVDLLGSDSDVVVQEGTRPDTSPADPRPAPLVKLTLKRQRTSRSDSGDSDDSDDTYHPPATRRRRRPRSPHSARSSHSSHSAHSSQSAHSSPSAHSSRSAHSSHSAHSSPSAHTSHSAQSSHSTHSSHSAPSCHTAVSALSSHSALSTHTALSVLSPHIAHSSHTAHSSHSIPSSHSAHSSHTAIPSNSPHSSQSAAATNTRASTPSTPPLPPTFDATNASVGRASTSRAFCSSSSSESVDDNASGSDGRRPRFARRKSRKRSRRDAPASRRERRRGERRPSRGHRADKTPTQDARADRDRHNKRKSHTGKGVKSSKRRESGTTERAVEHDEPGPSRRRPARRRASRDARRLRSVVNVMTAAGDAAASVSQRAGAASGADSAASGGRGERAGRRGRGTRAARSSTSDSEDDLPLNLTVQKMHPIS